MAEHAAALLRAARAAVRLRLAEDEALARLLDASIEATPPDLARAIAACGHLPASDVHTAAMQRLLIKARDLGLFRTE